MRCYQGKIYKQSCGRATPHTVITPQGGVLREGSTARILVEGDPISTSKVLYMFADYGGRRHLHCCQDRRSLVNSVTNHPGLPVRILALKVLRPVKALSLMQIGMVE